MPERAATSRIYSQNFQDLMRFRVREILLVAAPYDVFVLEEEGELAERMLGEFRSLELHIVPGLTGVATGNEALELVRAKRRFDLVLVTPQLADMHAGELARRLRAEGCDAPVVLLAREVLEVAEFAARHGLAEIERAFVWQGDARILVAIVQLVEDRRNLEHDAGERGVQVILLVEDGVRQYSSFLPAMYGQLVEHSRRVLAEGLNLGQKLLRLRARPKIVLATNYEEAEAAFAQYAEGVLGIVSDVEFPRGGEVGFQAGAELAALVRAGYPDIPIILHSSRPENEELARRIGCSFLLKGSPHLLEDLGRVMLDDFGFGDFVFRLPDGTEVDRASDLKSLEAKLGTVPEESILFHATRNHFSRWLKARTEFTVAYELRPQRPEKYPTPAALRDYLRRAIASYRALRSETVVADFDRARFDFSVDFYRVGAGSLGGKARGLAFFRRLLAERQLRRRFPGVEISVPAAVVLGTDVFDQFLEINRLRRFAAECDEDAELHRRFAGAELPAGVLADLEAFLALARYPLAVRSSSLLEDSQQQPFTGVYDTLVIPNDAGSVAERVALAGMAIRTVYASAFTRAAKSYLAATGYRLEEERMAVLLQRIVGARRGPRFYPLLSGVARSYNFYPMAPMRPEDGIAALALGLGRAIVEGGRCLRFCPRYPHHLPQLATSREALATTQRGFWALRIGERGQAATMREERFGLDVAERDGTLGAIASTYSIENDTLSDGIARAGTRVLTFAPLLRRGTPPIAEIVDLMLAEGARAVGSPVEVEFAFEPTENQHGRAEFALLQVRPLALSAETEVTELGEIDPDLLVCRSDRAMGNGAIEGLADAVVVDARRFERAHSRAAATEIGRLNAELIAAGRPYLLIGVGRWGSRDPWLGIPVAWEQVSGARVIVESSFRDLTIEPSQGSHFFQNLASRGVAFLTIDGPEGFVDWEWLARQPAEGEVALVRHLRFGRPLSARVDGRRSVGVVTRPKPAG